MADPGRSQAPAAAPTGSPPPTPVRATPLPVPPPQSAQAASVDEPPALPCADPDAAWQRVCVKLRQQPSLASLADDLSLTTLADGVAVFSAPTSTKANYARTRQSTLSDILTEITGARVRIEVRTAQSRSTAAAPATVPSSVAHAEAVKDPLVRRAMELFDARVVDVSDDAPGQQSQAASPADGTTEGAERDDEITA